MFYRTKAAQFIINKLEHFLLITPDNQPIGHGSFIIYEKYKIIGCPIVQAVSIDNPEDYLSKYIDKSGCQFSDLDHVMRIFYQKFDQLLGNQEPIILMKDARKAIKEGIKSVKKYYNITNKELMTVA